MIRDALGVRLIARGDTLHYRRPDEAADQAERAFEQLRKLLKQNGDIQPEDVRTVLAVVQRGDERGGPTSLGIRRGRQKFLRPRTDGQARYVHAMRDNDVVLAVGPAGTGKTYLAVAMAVSLMRQNLIRRIVLVRPAVEAGRTARIPAGRHRRQGQPLPAPLFDALNDMMEPEQVKRYMENDMIEIAPLAFMRGRTLNQAAIILDEGQNTTIPQMRMFLTRMGHGSKIIVTGDITQVDLPPSMRSGLADAVHRLKGIERIGIVYLDENDIVRHPLVQRIVGAYEDEGRRRRS